MSARLRRRSLFAWIAATLLLSPMAFAASPEGARQEGSARRALAVPATPEARLELWTRSLQTFLASHPGLSAEQREVLRTALTGADPDLFAESPDAFQKTQIATALSEIKGALLCSQYGEVFSGFQGLGAWLQQSAIAADTLLPCNCGDGGCAQGYECKSVGCAVDKGTTNWGRCVAVLPAPDPTPDPTGNPAGN